MKRLSFLFLALLACGLSFASSKTITLTYADFAAGYAKKGNAGTIDTTVLTYNDLQIAYGGMNSQSETGKTYKYMMLVEKCGYLYSAKAVEGYYPSLIIVTFSSTTGETGNIGINFNSRVLSTRIDNVSGEVIKRGTYTAINLDDTKLYWNISSALKNVQISSISVTYTPKGELPDYTKVSDIDIDSASVTLYPYQSTLINAKVMPDDAADRGVIWSTTDEKVVTVKNGKLTAVATGTAMIYAKSKENEVILDSCEINIVDKPLAKLKGDVLNADSLDATSTKYVDTKGVVGKSGAEYTANASRTKTGSIGLRQSNKDQAKSGITATKHPADSVIRAIYVDWNFSTNAERTLGVYLSHEPISLDTLYTKSDGKTIQPMTKIGVGIGAKYEVRGNWEYVAVRAFKGSIYLDQISFEWGDPVENPQPEEDEDTDEDTGDYNEDDEDEGEEYIDETGDDDNMEQAIGDVVVKPAAATKLFRNGQVIIIRGNRTFNLLGETIE
ncbi:MAG: Ig-like domain-containing protein [Paludibacteraceae bacterium]|nr:Ig-like domain-containing protein [Paludibacteraceae bacterium]